QACENPNTTRESRLCESARRHIAETIEDNLQREAEIAYLKANLNAGATLVDFAIGPKVPNVLGTAAKAADSILAARSMSNGYTAYRNFQRLQTTIGTAYEAVSAAGAVNSVVSVANDFVEVQRRNAQVDAAKQFRQDHLPPTSNQGTSATPAPPQIDP